MQVLILGCGDIGTRAGLSLLEGGWRVAAARRNPDRLPDQFDRHKVEQPTAQFVFSPIVGADTYFR